jgi:hypothetical protein
MLPSSKLALQAFYAEPDAALSRLLPGEPFSWMNKGKQQ